MLDDVSYCDFIKKLEIVTENTSNWEYVEQICDLYSG